MLKTNILIIRESNGNTEDEGWRGAVEVASETAVLHACNQFLLPPKVPCNLFLGWCKADPFVMAQPRDFRSLFDIYSISALVLASANVWRGVDIVTAVICIAISNIHCVIRYDVTRRRCKNRSLVYLTVNHGSNYICYIII